jgi:hypothetical protein
VDIFRILNKFNDLTVLVNGLERIATGEMEMQKSSLAMLAALLMLTVAGCAPLVVGGAAAVVADEAVEQDNGGDGLF